MCYFLGGSLKLVLFPADPHQKICKPTRSVKSERWFGVSWIFAVSAAHAQESENESCVLTTVEKNNKKMEQLVKF